VEIIWSRPSELVLNEPPSRSSSVGSFSFPCSIRDRRDEEAGEKEGEFNDDREKGRNMVRNLDWGGEDGERVAARRRKVDEGVDVDGEEGSEKGVKLDRAMELEAVP
jgi:hypothetical protein